MYYVALFYFTIKTLTWYFLLKMGHPKLLSKYMHEVLPPCGTFHTFVSAAVVTDVTLIGFFVCVQSGVTLQVRVDLELCPTHVTNEWRVACVGAKVHDQLT